MTQTRPIDTEMANLKRSVATMGHFVERSLHLAVEALRHPVIDARERARTFEDQLDSLDSEIEENCHRILALQSPVARDLRMLVSAMRVTIDLENIGDLAESLAKRATNIARNTIVGNPSVLEPLSNLARDMVHRCLACFIAGDLDEATRLVADEKESDRLTKAGYAEIQRQMRDDPEHIGEYLQLHRALSGLEQICDLALAIAEEAVYAHKGRIVRHHHGDLDAKLNPRI